MAETKPKGIKKPRDEPSMEKFMPVLELTTLSFFANQFADSLVHMFIITG